MCVVSFIGDHYNDKFKQPEWEFITTGPSQGEFDKLKKEVEDMRKLLIKAKIYDEETGQPDCEVEDKIGQLREIAKIVGIDLDDVLKSKGQN